MRQVKLGLGFKRTIGAAAPLRIAEVQGRLPNGVASSAGRNAQVFRWPYVIGANLKDIVLSLNNFYMGTSNETNTGNAVTVVEISIESAGGVVVPVTFGGSRARVLANGEHNVQSDPIPASAFGLGMIERAAIFWVKGIVTVPAAGNPVPQSNAVNVGDAATSQVCFYDTGATTPSSTDVAGVYTATGTAFTTVSFGFRPIMLGHPVTDGDSFIAVGDSIGQSLTDSASAGVWGRAFIQRAMGNYGVSPRPCMNFCIASARTTLFTGGSKWKSFIPYATKAIDECGTNDVDEGANIATIQSRFDTLWGALKAGGIAKIYRTELMCKTTSTDNWATTANQTVVARWGAGEEADQLNTWFLSKAADGTLKAVCSTREVKDPVTPSKWRCDEYATTRYSTYDWLHPSESGHINLAWTLRQTVIEDEVLHYGSVSDNALWLDSSDPSSLLDANAVSAAMGGFLGQVATWTDKSGRGYHATQSNNAKRPGFGGRTINGHTVVDFDGSDDALAVSNQIVNSGGSTVFVVFLPDNTNTGLSLFANSGSTGSSNRFAVNNQASDFSNSLLARVTPASGAPIIQVATVNKNTGGARQRMYINTDAAQTQASPRGVTQTGGAVGAHGNASSAYFDGGVGLVLFYRKPLTPAEINYVAGLISQSWGTSLAPVLL